MSFNNINKAFENRFNVSKNILNEELRNKKLKDKAKSKLLESVDKTLSERHWKFTIPGNYRNAIFDAADEEDFDSVRFALMDICQYVIDHIEESEEFDEESIEDIKDEYSDLLEELDYQDFEDEDECNYWLNELYDLMDNTDIFLGLRESFKESFIDSEFLNGDKVKYFNDYSEAKKYADKLGLKESEYGDAYGCSYCCWNETGDKNDTEMVVAYYDFQNGKPVKLSPKSAESIKKNIDIDFTECLKESLWTDIVKKVPELEEGINESSNNQKFWVLFFDENGYNPAGSDYTHAFNVLPATIEKRLKSKDYYLPKEAKSYVILSDHQFRKMDYDDIYKYHQKYGKSLNEDTKKIVDGKWVNKGKEGTHGEFRTKKEADAQRKAMFANGYKESLKENVDLSESFKDDLRHDVFVALSDICQFYYRKGHHPTEQEMDYAIEWFQTHFWNSDDDLSYLECLTEDKDLSKVKGSMTQVLSDNKSWQNETTVKGLYDKIKSLLDKNNIDTQASRRLLNNINKSKSLTNAQFIIYNSILAGSNNKVITK